jgi:hypothetical protein
MHVNGFLPVFLAEKPGESIGVPNISGGPSPKRGAQDDRFGFELSMTDLKSLASLRRDLRLRENSSSGIDLGL